MSATSNCNSLSIPFRDDLSRAARRLLGVLRLFPNPEGKECHVREHIRQLIEEARLPKVATDGDGNRPAVLGSHVIRLAQMAAAMHIHEAVQGWFRAEVTVSSELSEVGS